MLHSFVGKSDTNGAVAINTIGTTRAATRCGS
jgi:hypothetical protein